MRSPESDPKREASRVEDLSDLRMPSRSADSPDQWSNLSRVSGAAVLAATIAAGFGGCSSHKTSSANDAVRPASTETATNTPAPKQFSKTVELADCEDALRRIMN